MDQFEFMKQLGEGSYGRVFQARSKETGKIVAIKEMKNKCRSWKECMNMMEVKSLKKMDHPNIIRLEQVTQEHDVLYFVFEHMDCNLLEFFQRRKKKATEDEVRNWCFQVFNGLAYMHQQGYFHRDLKPENLLVSSKEGQEVIKIADFGMAREISSRPPYTDYVSTRWYRAPEVLLGSQSYGAAIDMWAMGAIIAEMFTLRPLFCGSNEPDQIYKICKVMGSPNQGTWPHGLQLANSYNFQFPWSRGIDLSRLLGPTVSQEAIHLITSLCSWDPCNRPTAAQALQHPFFRRLFNVPRPLYRRSVRGIIPPPPPPPQVTRPDSYMANSRASRKALEESISNVTGNLSQLAIRH